MPSSIFWSRHSLLDIPIMSPDGKTANVCRHHLHSLAGVAYCTHACTVPALWTSFTSHGSSRGISGWPRGTCGGYHRLDRERSVAPSGFNRSHSARSTDPHRKLSIQPRHQVPVYQQSENHRGRLRESILEKIFTGKD